ncbi:MAG: hypothetical protein DKT66_15020 [Candidatus Melainabacteria bacterium]|nr:MAG: hypothetical protein DKT66_15020 [Candidatus Melainabacteria bacterium]
MSNRFGLNTGANGGDNNLLAANASETETEAPKTSGLNFNSVVSSSFNEALTNADQMLKGQQTLPKTDTSTAGSVTTNFLGATVTGLADQVTTIFKKDKATLAREADQGGISALSEGHSITAAFTRTATDVAHAAPALNPFSEQGRKNWGTLTNKMATDWSTGTADDKARMLGTGTSFLLTLGGGTALTTKGTVGIANELRGGTLATRALSLGDNVAAATDELANVGRTVGRVTETGTTKSHTFFREAGQATSVTENIVARATNLGETAAFRGPKATTVGIGTEVAAGESSLIKSLHGFYPNVRPANITSAAFTDASKTAALTESRNFSSSLTRMLTATEKTDVAATTALKEVENAAAAMFKGEAGAQARFTQAVENSAAHLKGPQLQELTGQSNQLLRSIERAGTVEAFGMTVDNAAKNIGTKIEGLTVGVGKNSQEAKALQNIQTLVNDVARGGNKTDELISAVKALKADAPGLNPQVVESLVADVAKLEGASVGRRLLTRFETYADDARQAATKIEQAIQKEAPQSGSLQAQALDEVRVAANKLANGAIRPEEFAQAVDKLKQTGNVSADTLKEITRQAGNLTESVNATRLFTHMDDLVKPVKAATSELDNVLAPLKATSPQQVAKVEQAVADFVAGRSGSTEELTAALRNLANNEKSLATKAGGNVDEALAQVARVSDNITAQTSKVVEAAEKARPALTLERSIAESAPVLEEAARKWAGNPTNLKAIEEVQTAFNGAMKGNVTADELALVIQKNSRVLERAVPGATETLTVNGSKIADAATDATRTLAIKGGVVDLGKGADEAVQALKTLQTQVGGDAAKVQSLRNFEEAVTAFKASSKSADDIERLGNAAKEVRAAEVKLPQALDNFASSAERTSRLQAIETSVVKSRQATNGITATTDIMEAAVRQADEFKAIDRLRTAVRSGDRDAIAAAVKESEQGLAKLEQLQPGFRSVLDDAVKAGDNKQLTKLTNALDNVELVAQRSSNEFKALEEIRAAARRAATDGIGDDLARVIQKNQTQIDNMQNMVTRMEQAAIKTEGRVAAAETKVTNVAERLSTDAKVLGDEAANVRKLTNIENSSRSMTNVVENLAPKLDDVAKQTSFMSSQGGKQLAKDVRELAETMPATSESRARLIAKAEQLESQAGKFNHVSERLNVIKSLSDDVARGTVKESDMMSFVKKSSTQLDELGKGTAAMVESKASAIADSRKLAVADDAINAARRLPNAADEAARLGFKTDSEVNKLATDFNSALRKFTNGDGAIADVNAAAKKLNEFKPAVALSEVEARNLQTLKQTVEGFEKTAQTMQNARASAFESQFKAYMDAANSGKVASYKNALNSIANMYEVSPPAVQSQLLKLRESILDHWAARLVSEQGYYGKNTLAQRAFGGMDGGQSLISQVKAGSFNVRPIAGLETNKGQLLDAAERFNRNIMENQVKFSVRGLTQDKTALLANPNLAQESLRHKLVKDILTTAAGVGLVSAGGIELKKKAQDYIYDEVNAPYVMAALMEKEIAARTDADREKYRAELAAKVADYIRGKDQAQIDALREQIKQIIAERTAENPEAQAVWTRQREALTVGQLRVKKEHENQVQYGNPMGPTRGPGTPSTAAESSQQVFVATPARVRANSTSNLDDSSKRKPATTNFDINKIKDMSNNMAYNQSSLRANPYGNSGPNSLAAAYTSGASKAWQNVVSWNTGRKLTAGEPGGKHVYGNFSHLEEQPENDQAGFGGAAAQPGAGRVDPASLALAASAAQQQQKQANQDENTPGATV